jgi:hypothetical protein
MCQKAAALYGIPVGVWMRRVLAFEAGRARLAAATTPQGLHPKAQIWRVTDAPAQGAWAYRPYFTATGIERIWVTSLLEDAPPSIAKDGRACVVDILNGGKNLVVAYRDVRWIGASPLDNQAWTSKAKEEERGGTAS